MDFREDEIDRPDVIALLTVHLEHANEHSPPESVHALDISSLKGPGITFWTARDGDDDLLGCGALAEIGPGHGEIKSMHTAERHRGKGIAKNVLDFILNQARQRGLERVSLETGSMDAYGPARALYASAGFEECGPYAGYELDPNSVFMTKSPV